jgi:RNA polymerase sigma factor (sigma-70 family)
MVTLDKRVHFRHTAEGIIMYCDPENRDRALVQQCLSGSREAWEEFYRHFFMLVSKAIRTKAHCKESDVQDLVQSAFLAVYTSLKTYDYQYPLSRFVWIVSERVCIDEFRKSRAAKRDGPTVPVDPHDGDDDEAIMIRSNLDDQEQQLADAEVKQILMTAFKRLGEKCRELIRLRYLQELSFKEIASLLGKKEKSLAVQAGRCLQDLKELYLRAEKRVTS